MLSIRSFAAVLAAGVVVLSAEVSLAALAKQQGGSGNSGTLSSNRAVRKQQLIADPDNPTGGSTSVAYDTSVVTVTGLIFGPGYTGSGAVEVDTGDGIILQPMGSFLTSPAGTETGYIQVSFGESTFTAPTSPTGSITPQGTPLPVHGQISPPSGYFMVDEDGPAAVDTHALEFLYKPNVSDRTIASYTVYLDPGGRPSGNSADSWTARNDLGEEFTLDPSQVASATVRGNLIPLPPAVWAGLLTLGAMGAVALKRRLRARAA